MSACGYIHVNADAHRARGIRSPGGGVRGLMSFLTWVLGTKLIGSTASVLAWWSIFPAPWTGVFYVNWVLKDLVWMLTCPKLRSVKKVRKMGIPWCNFLEVKVRKDGIFQWCYFLRIIHTPNALYMACVHDYPEVVTAQVWWRPYNVKTGTCLYSTTEQCWSKYACSR